MQKKRMRQKQRKMTQIRLSDDMPKIVVNTHGTKVLMASTILKGNSL